MQTASTKIRQREHNKWVIWAQPLHESTFINVVSSEERSNNRAVWLLLLAVTLKATTESLTCRLWVRASIHWHYWQKYPICMYLCELRNERWGGRRRDKKVEEEEEEEQNVHVFIFANLSCARGERRNWCGSNSNQRRFWQLRIQICWTGGSRRWGARAKRNKRQEILWDTPARHLKQASIDWNLYVACLNKCFLSLCRFCCRSARSW